MYKTEVVAGMGNDIVIINGVQYKSITNANGEIVSLKRFNEKAKMWVTVNFSNITEAEHTEIMNYVTTVLSEEYIKSQK
ncbi:hypothetical protein [Paenibacillus sp. JDR-2]|uniref:hypothetical protein n=1 Tax=Paenibacillus sp. (strain JDR-2) TaxID=324057 RepID=UPI000166A6CB|nr:hypothetical protein [Paenibacillus sp. JDR-2]ACT00276.1 hypothetical protein Pjdr2_1607 [Paenibacillus sp. JDR-2]